MNRTEAALYIKSKYADYLRPAKKKGTFICPIPGCGNGTGKDGDGLVIDPRAKNPYTLHCFKCGFHGDIIDLYQKEHVCDTATAFNDLYKMFGVTIDEKQGDKMAAEPRNEGQRITTTFTAEKPAEGEITPYTANTDYTAKYEACRGQINDPTAQNYLKSRGISEATAARYGIGYDSKEKFIIIPVSSSFYIARNTDAGSTFRYNNPKGASIDIFNKAALYGDTARPVFITEGAIDALSIIEAGGQAVALNSTANVRKLLADLEEKPTRSPLILCLDNDDAGRKATAELAEGLNGLNIAHITADITGKYKDPNEALINDRGAFIAAVAAAERSTSKPYNTADYIRQGMGAEIEKMKLQRGRKSGFYNLDERAGSIYAGLYCVGAISSLGKTTFVYQLCDQLAAEGDHVLYFSMEQSRLEMVSKSIARQTAINDPAHATSSLQIRIGANNEGIRRAIADYVGSVGDRVSVIEGNYNCTVSFIGDTARAYREHNGVTPVIAVDYLQILRPDVDPRTGRAPTDPRIIVDNNLVALKRLSRELETPVIVICSINRSNYLTPIDFEAFKESGAIEFTADVVWGLQLDVMNDPIFNKEGKVKEKREAVAAAKAADPRSIELVCLKNRFGISRYSVNFNYYPAYDYFTPA